MNMSRLVVLATAFAGLAGFGSTAYADAAAGKATFTKICAECHEAGDFDGEDPKEVAATIKSIVAGTTKHKEKLALTDQEISDVAAYMAAGGK
ncbi:MAG TPA: c-type cytochrome [Steroidobacteraceae bacterium]|nr:c-type cytochrome [Steroidobacteraceae bacterium]